MSQTQGLRNDQQDPIKESHNRFLSAILSGDVQTLVSLHTKSGVLMPPNDTTLYGQAELEEWYREYFHNFRVVTFEVIERDVMSFDALAVERWTYMVAIQPRDGGERIRDDGRLLTVWIQESGEWRMSQSMFNSIRPIGSGTIRFLALLKKKADRTVTPER